MATYLLKLSDEDYARWKDEARAEGLSLAAYIRGKVNGRSFLRYVPENDVVRHAETGERVKITVKRPRAKTKTVCPRAHFHRSGVLCKTCGTTP